MTCPYCGKTLKKTLVANPYGLARVDIYYCANEDCTSFFVGSMYAWEKVRNLEKSLKAIADMESKICTEDPCDLLNEAIRIAKDKK